VRVFGYEIVIRRSSVSGSEKPVPVQHWLSKLFREMGKPRICVMNGEHSALPSNSLGPVVAAWIVDHVPAPQRNAVAELYRDIMAKKHIEVNLLNRESARISRLIKIDGAQDDSGT
jgi:hypothetical protein